MVSFSVSVIENLVVDVLQSILLIFIEEILMITKFGMIVSWQDVAWPKVVIPVVDILTLFLIKTIINT